MELRVPDMLCFSRVILAVFLFFLEPLSDAFLALYTVCCLTDVLDGRIARYQGDAKPYGQALDSGADAFLGIVMLICVIPSVDWEPWMLYWIAAIIAIRLVSLGIGSGKYGKVAFIHTYMNKLAGFLLFLVPFLLRVLDEAPVAAALCAVTTVSALEYLYINVTSEHLDRELHSARDMK